MRTLPLFSSVAQTPTGEFGSDVAAEATGAGCGAGAGAAATGAAAEAERAAQIRFVPQQVLERARRRRSRDRSGGLRRGGLGRSGGGRCRRRGHDIIVGILLLEPMPLRSILPACLNSRAR